MASVAAQMDGCWWCGTTTWSRKGGEAVNGLPAVALERGEALGPASPASTRIHKDCAAAVRKKASALAAEEHAAPPARSTRSAVETARPDSKRPAVGGWATVSRPGTDLGLPPPGKAQRVDALDRMDADPSPPPRPPPPPTAAPAPAPTASSQEEAAETPGARVAARSRTSIRWLSVEGGSDSEMALRCRNEMAARRQVDDELRAAEARLATAEKTIAALRQEVAVGAPARARLSELEKASRGAVSYKTFLQAAAICKDAGHQCAPEPKCQSFPHTCSLLARTPPAVTCAAISPCG